MATINANTPISSLTIGEFTELLKESLNAPQPEETRDRFVYGLDGICRLFNVSKKTAIEYKRTWLKPACDQVGRTIVVNADLAMVLFNRKSKEGRL